MATDFMTVMTYWYASTAEFLKQILVYFPYLLRFLITENKEVNNRTVLQSLFLGRNHITQAGRILSGFFQAYLFTCLLYYPAAVLTGMWESKTAVSQEDKAGSSLSVGAKPKEEGTGISWAASKSVRMGGDGGNCVKCSFVFLPNVMLSVFPEIKKKKRALLMAGIHHSVIYLKPPRRGKECKIKCV